MSAIVNVDQAATWDGDEGAHWAANWTYYEGSTRPHTELLLARAAIGDGERVLDLGCGNGGTSLLAARAAGSGSVLGVDLSSQMLANARKRAAEEGLGNVEFEQADVQVHNFPDATFDLAMSRFGVMFFSDPVAAFSNVRRALRAGGRLCLLVWGPMASNDWLTGLRGALAMGRTLPEPPPGAPSPVGFGDCDFVHDVLSKAGFDDICFDREELPMRIADTVDEAYERYVGLGAVRGLLADLDEETKAKGLENLRQALAERASADGVCWGSTAQVIGARRA